MDSVNGMTVFIIMAIVVTALVKVVSLLNDNYNATHNQPTRSRTPPSASTSRPAANPSPPRRTAAVETGPMIYFANDHHGRRDREYRFNYKRWATPGGPTFYEHPAWKAAPRMRP